MPLTKSFNPHIAVIGCGGWGRNLVRTMGRLGALRAVVDASAAGRERSRQLMPQVPALADAEDVFDDPEVTAVMIATPAETHYAVACRALEAGKHVFVEKPLTVHVPEARDLVARAEAAGVVLMVGHLLEYHPAILALRDLVEAGELGSIHYLVSNRLNLGKIRTEENALWSFAPHDIAVILRLVGAMPIEVVATGGCYVSPHLADVSVTQLLFENGVRCHIFVSWLHPFKEQRLVVVGSRKMASFDDVEKKLVLYDQRVDWEQGQPVPVRGEGIEVNYSPVEPLEEECRHFLECVASGRAPRTDGRSGLDVLRILEAAQHSLTNGGRPQTIAAEAAPAEPAPAPIIIVSPMTSHGRAHLGS